MWIALGGVESVASYLVNRYYCGVLLGQNACDLAIRMDYGVMGVTAVVTLIFTSFFLYKGFQRQSQAIKDQRLSND